MVWIGFLALVLVMLALDLGVFHRTARVVKVSEALAWSGIWFIVALLFGIFVYFGYEQHWLGLGSAVDAVAGRPNDGGAALAKYLTGYIVEKSLSVDNIFVIAMVFKSMAIPAIYQHRVLFWGILGALVMRGAMIGVGAELIGRYHWILYIFGGFLILTGIKMLVMRADHGDPSQTVIVRLVRRWLPVSDRLDGEHFVTRAISGAWRLTPLAMTLIIVEATDLIFAVDSIPAIFAITADPFLVMTSNVFAILGLRSLYFALAGMMDKFRYLKVSLAVILLLVGGKMLFAAPLKALLGSSFNFWLLGLILLILAAGVTASMLASRVQTRVAADVRLEGS